MAEQPTPSSTGPRPPGSARPALARRLDRWRGLDASRGWFRGILKRDELTDKLKTLGWVVPLALLIWIYAEREQTAVESDVLFPIAFKSLEADRVIELIDPENATIRAELSGPRSRLDRIRQVLDPGTGNPAVQIEIDDSFSPGSREIPTVTQLANHPVFTRNGVTVKSASPPVMRIHVDQIVERDARVQVPQEVNNLDGPPTFDPPTVTVRGPRRVLDQAELNGQLVVFAALAGSDVLRTPGQHDLPEVSLIRSPELQHEHVSLSTTKVRAGLMVKQANVEYTLPSVPVWLTSAPGLLDRYRIHIAEPTLTNVTVTGPPDQIDLLSQIDYSPKPKAFVEVFREDAGQERSRRVRYYDLPEGVQVVERDARREITFTLSERAASE